MCEWKQGTGSSNRLDFIHPVMASSTDPGAVTTARLRAQNPGVWNTPAEWHSTVGSTVAGAVCNPACPNLTSTGESLLPLFSRLKRSRSIYQDEPRRPVIVIGTRDIDDALTALECPLLPLSHRLPWCGVAVSRYAAWRYAACQLRPADSLHWRPALDQPDPVLGKLAGAISSVEPRLR